MKLRKHATTSTVEHGRRNDPLRRWLECPVGMFSEKARDLLVVLLKLQRARAVHEQPAGSYDACRGAKNRALRSGQHREVARLQSPASVGVTTKRSRARERNVYQHGIHVAQRRRCRIAHEGKDVRRIESLHVLSHAQQPNAR